MRYLSVCSGIEAATQAWHPLGWEPVAFSEVDKFPCAVLAHHYPDVPNWGDMTKFKEWPDANVDVLVGGTPCFPAGTRILTRNGFVSIQDIEVGDEVLSHKGRWKRVLRWGSKEAQTIKLHGQGQSSGIETTANHPFYACKKEWTWVGRENGNRRVDLTAAEWVPADQMVCKMWASPSKFPMADPPCIQTIGRESEAPPFSDKLAYVVGRWLGDGWTRINERRGYALICCSNAEAEFLEEAIRSAGLHASRMQERTTTRFQIANRAFARWLVDNFGSGASGKTMPAWVFGWSLRKSFMDGYIAADGCRTPNGWRISTISQDLALGAVLLAHSLGMSASRRVVKPKRKQCVIEGREVKEAPFYQVSLYETPRSSIDDGMHRWGLVRKQSYGRETTVFNIEVEGDNSYVADGIVVHNCQSFSIAGLRKGLDDPRGNLMLTYLAIAARYRPRWLVWENVPGVLSSNGGRDFGTLIGGLEKLGYHAAWRVLDAQYVRTRSFPWAVPQRRRRVFVVGYLGDWRRAAAVLFNAESLRRDSPPRRKAGQAVAPTISARTQGGGGLGTDFELDGGVLAHEVASCLNASFGSKQGLEDQHINSGAPSFVAHALRGEGFDAETENFVGYIPKDHGRYARGLPTLRAKGADAGGGSEAIIAFDCKGTEVQFSIDGSHPTLRSMGHNKSHQNAGGHAAVAIQERAISENPNAGPDGAGVRADGASYTLEARTVPQAVAFDMRGREGGAQFEGPHDTANIRAASGGSSRSYVADHWAVRRLTPKEAERLQGFRDDYTRIPYRGKPADACPDGPRYKALGNSMAVNVMQWLGERVQHVENIMRGEDAA